MKRLGLLAVLAVAAPAASTALDAQDIGLALGTKPPAVTVQDLDGKPVDLGRYVAKQPLVLQFWATWCPLCKALEPSLQAAHARYRDQVQFLAVAVAVNQSQRSIRRHLAAHPLPFPVLYDADGAAVRAYQAPTTSYIVVLDASGKVVYTGAGEEQDIAAVLAQVTAK